MQQPTPQNTQMPTNQIWMQQPPMANQVPQSAVHYAPIMPPVAQAQPTPPSLAPKKASPRRKPTSSRQAKWGRISLGIAGLVVIALTTWSIAGTSGNGTAKAGQPGIGLPTVAKDVVVTTPPAKVVTTPPAKVVTTPPAKVEVAPTPPAKQPELSTPPSKVVVAPTTTMEAPPTKAPETSTTTITPPVKGGGPAIADEALPEVAEPAAAATAPAAFGGGAAPRPSGQLPYTGAETWIAAILGVLILGLGIAVQFNAVRIGMTAMLYRRGILLRPVDCARLANEHGLSRVRVVISNLLHRLLEEPEGADFVTMR